MIISRTPFRISLFGGGSDYPEWYQENGGSVFGFAINKYCYISLRELPPFFEHKHRIVYSRIELVNSPREIIHPAVRTVLEQFPTDCGLEIHHDGDLPARSGLGSSSSFSVGLIHALKAFGHRMSSPRSLAEEAIHIEQDVIGENVGSQDQVWAAYGGINKIDFMRDGNFIVSPVLIESERKTELMQSMLLVFTGITRIASDFAGPQIANQRNRESHIREMLAMVETGIDLATNSSDPVRELGQLLHDSWRLKRELADGVSNSTIDDLYEAGRNSGAYGGKLLGAGGGGFLLFVAPSSKIQTIRDHFKNHVCVDFDVDTSGSRIIVYHPDELHNEE